MTLFFFDPIIYDLHELKAILVAEASKRGGLGGASPTPKQTNKQESVCADKLQAPAYPFLVTD